MNSSPSDMEDDSALDLKHNRSSKKGTSKTLQDGKQRKLKEKKKIKEELYDPSDGKSLDPFWNAAQWIPRDIDLYCNITSDFRIAMILKSIDKEDQQRSEDDKQRAVSNFDKIVDFVPEFKKMLHRKNKDKLDFILKKMYTIMRSTRADDSSRLRKDIPKYVPPDPSTMSLNPPILTGSKEDRSGLGFAHPQLALLLCLIMATKMSKYFTLDLALFFMVFFRTRIKLLDGRIRVTASKLPAFMYIGFEPAEQYNPNAIHEGLLKGYYVPRAYLYRAWDGTQGLNLQDKTISYAIIQGRHALTSRESWLSDGMDKHFNYKDFYDQINTLLEDPTDPWAKDVLTFFDLNVFGYSNTGINDNQSESDDDIAQFMTQRAARRTANSNIAMVANPAQPAGELEATPSI
ncbi:hypothetical protein SERLADRAFT_442528 [Serpula lacrymans var. lacrymans S7.9]|uniref:Uncharacterized protein n=1 Tax=Serpula lacrymans var. lacrymans (strain S7.9) TaxID=578457 RepID=F8P9R5_SERL9|nr:uncharacterized protein SERLADRAFT_442528 [Serpula lacrymans var. lacrymans S7.9]EGO20394.1 hypothetical protein SERLADRAFT_442528 [Serpula lacrymans var. lacrymans S7.9]